jgi:hypothetical protein
MPPFCTSRCALVTFLGAVPGLQPSPFSLNGSQQPPADVLGDVAGELDRLLLKLQAQPELQADCETLRETQAKVRRRARRSCAAFAADESCVDDAAGGVEAQSLL